MTMSDKIERRTFIDFHCHPTMKPYGKSFPAMENSSNRQQKHSIWYYDPPKVSDKLINYISGLTKFRQADFTTLAKGGAICISVSLYPPEKGFFKPLGQTGKLADIVTNLVTGIGRMRIDHIQKYESYWHDLEREYDFLTQLDGRVYTIDKEKYSYHIINSFDELEALNLDSDVNRIGIFLSIEGLHVLDCGLDQPADETVVLNHVDDLKKWKHRVFFVTVAHHFYNILAGHAKSLGALTSSVLTQDLGLNAGITELGKKVIHKLLSQENGKPIYVDIKHMSRTSRKAYFHMLDTEFKNIPIPIIVSHGAVTGLKDESGAETIPGAGHRFYNPDINLYDDELVRISQSRGIFCLQVDERRIASETELKNAGTRLSVRKMRFYRSRLLWAQVQHIAEVLNAHGLFAWDIQALGTDFDGIVDPLNGFWSSEYFPHLETYMLMHANNYMKNGGQSLLPINQINQEEIIDRVFINNAKAFLQRWF